MRAYLSVSVSVCLSVSQSVSQANTDSIACLMVTKRLPRVAASRSRGSSQRRAAAPSAAAAASSAAAFSCATTDWNSSTRSEKGMRHGAWLSSNHTRAPMPGTASLAAGGAALLLPPVINEAVVPSARSPVSLLLLGGGCGATPVAGRRARCDCCFGCQGGA